MNTDHHALADAALARWGHDPHALVQVLRETQAQTHWLPRALLTHIGQALHLPLAQVEGVATFYRFFHTRPVGRLRVLFSDNITDRLLGSEALLARLCERLGLAPGETDAQGRFSVDRASCTGLCDQGDVPTGRTLALDGLAATRAHGLRRVESRPDLAANPTRGQRRSATGQAIQGRDSGCRVGLSRWQKSGFPLRRRQGPDWHRGRGRAVGARPVQHARRSRSSS